MREKAFSRPRNPGAERIPITMVAANVDTGEYDIYGEAAAGFLTVSVQGNFRDESYQSSVCVAWLHCFEERQAPRKRNEQHADAQSDTYRGESRENSHD